MRFLYYPIYSNPNLKNCSTVNWAKAWFDVLDRNGRKFFCYWITPKEEDDIKYFRWKNFDDGMFRPHIKYLKVLIPNKQYNQKAYCDNELYKLFAESTGKNFISALVAESGFLAVMLRKMISEFNFRLSFQMPVFLNHGFFMSKEKGPWMSPDFELGEVIGMSMSYNIFATQGSLEMAHTVARRYLAPNVYNKVVERSVVIPTGIMCEELDGVKEEKRKDAFCIHYSSRFNSYYNSKSLLDITDALFKSGSNVKFVMTVPNNPSGLNGYDRPYIEMYKGLPKNIYYKKMSQSHAFIADMSQTQEFSMAIGEMMYAGLVGVFKRCKWTDAFLPESYPYRYNTAIEATACLRTIKEKIENKQMDEFIKDMKEYVKERYSLQAKGLVLYDYMTKIVEKHRKEEFKGSSGIDNICKLTYDSKLDNFTFDKFCEEIVKIKGVQLNYDIRNKVNRSGLSQSTFYHSLLRNGFEDTCEYDFPKLRRIK